ncbi:MAG: hypothetical protein R2851_12670 [Caldilineaceae bacterium]
MAKDTRTALGDRSAQHGADPHRADSNSADIDFIGLLTLLAVAAFIFLSFELADLASGPRCSVWCSSAASSTIAPV